MRFITKKHLPRRTFLPGLGVTMSLPPLDLSYAQPKLRTLSRFTQALSVPECRSSDLVAG